MRTMVVIALAVLLGVSCANLRSTATLMGGHGDIEALGGWAGHGDIEALGGWA